MDMKNTVILLIFLLSILGLMIGVYYNDIDDLTGYKEVVTEKDDGTILIHLEKDENDPSLVNRITNIGKSNFTNWLKLISQPFGIFK